MNRWMKWAAVGVMMLAPVQHQCRTVTMEYKGGVRKTFNVRMDYCLDGYPGPEMITCFMNVAGDDVAVLTGERSQFKRDVPCGTDRKKKIDSLK